MNKEDFINSCIKLNTDIVVQQFIIDGSYYFFDTIKKGEEFNFKKAIANSLDVHIRDIVIVGSGKLGFSIKPDESSLSFYPFKDFDYNFNVNAENEKSDLDVAIVSSKLFDEQLISLYSHTNGYLKSEYSKSGQLSGFAKYILKGWLRPDKVPNDYVITSDIRKVQEEYKTKFGREVNIGIYKSWYFFENYHQNNIRRIKLNKMIES